ncbi:MAG: proton-conducting transporter membrane subunit, partial [Terriglobales bacterium]
MRRMGGLRTKIPWTFWTMTAGTFAIAGFPPLAGFFSKDAILWQAYSSPYGSWVYWAIGVFTAFLTSFYMFRQWFLTFFGEYRGEEKDHDQQPRAGAPAPHGHVHESPAVMLAPLVILAVLSVCGGWIGSERFDKFLAPVFHPNVITTVVVGASQGNQAAMPPEPAPQKENTSETLFTGISVSAALFGFLLAWQLYHRRPQLPEQIAVSLDGIYRAVLNKYYVDEFYATLFVKPMIDGSTKLLWHGVDQDVIDATLDNSADGAREVSDAVRHMQSGNIRSYAGWVAAGAAVVIFYMVWMGTR